jgi:hypothetical protein
VSDGYPRWRFFPAFRPPPYWVPALISIFEANRGQIDSLVVHAKRMESDDVLRVLADELEHDMRFAVERGKKRMGKLPRPVFFGDQGTYLRTYEIDAFQADHGIALEVEAGRATMGNAIYRDIIQGSLIVDARFLALAVPVEYRYKSGARETKEPSYAKTYSVVEAIYGSPRLQLPFEGLLLIGYWAQRRARLAPIGRRGCCVRTGVQAEPVRAWGRSLASWVAGGGCWRTTGGDGPRLASGRLTQRTPSEIPRPHEGRANQPRDAPLALQVVRL